MTIRNVWVVASLGLAACSGSAGDGAAIGVIAAAGVVDKADGNILRQDKCPGYLCPVLDGAVGPYRFAEGDTAETFVGDLAIIGAERGLGKPDPQSRAAAHVVASQTAGGIPVLLQISGDQLSAIETVWPFDILSGQALEGLTIWLSSAQNELFELVVTDVSFQDLHFWEGALDTVVAYELTAQRIDPPDPKGPAFVCSGAGTVGDPLWGGVPHAAMFFDGDSFDLEHVTVAAPASPTRFNLACPGSTRARMHLSRHTKASDHDGQFPTDRDQRQAMLKMLAADYCGDGESYTVDNYPLRWLDNTGWAQPPLDLDPKHGQITSIEAIWGPSGAVCLDTPRSVARSQVGCALPTCQDIAGWASQGHLISANPVQP